ncbi:hypothetical protein LINPERPRIM_LOCUS13360 [Linum perenne]
MFLSNLFEDGPHKGKVLWCSTLPYSYYLVFNSPPPKSLAFAGVFTSRRLQLLTISKERDFSLSTGVLFASLNLSRSTTFFSIAPSLPGMEPAQFNTFHLRTQFGVYSRFDYRLERDELRCDLCPGHESPAARFLLVHLEGVQQSDLQLHLTYPSLP